MFLKNILIEFRKKKLFFKIYWEILIETKHQNKNSWKTKIENNKKLIENNSLKKKKMIKKVPLESKKKSKKFLSKNVLSQKNRKFYISIIYFKGQVKFYSSGKKTCLLNFLRLLFFKFLHLFTSIF